MFEIIGERNSLLGESPVWDEARQCLHYVDIKGRKWITVQWKTKEYTVFELPQQAGCLFLNKDGSVGFGMEDGIYDSRYQLLHEPEPIAGSRFNDGKPGPDGLLYAGTIRSERGGKFYRLRKRRLESLLSDIRVSNGLDWSLDEKTMYYCDTPTRKIVAFDFPAMTNRRETAYFAETELGGPDGMCIDEEGCLWVALWGGGAVARISPETGEMLTRIPLPAAKISCPAFAGENLDELVVTSSGAGADLNKEPLAGCTFVLRPGVKGRAPYRRK